MKKNIAFIFVVLASFISGILLSQWRFEKKLNKEIEERNKNVLLFRMMVNWLKIRQAGYDISDYFNKRGYRKIAIYGMNYVGRALERELEKSDIEVAYGIDRNCNQMQGKMIIVQPGDVPDKVDVVVVTPIYYFDEIEEMVSEQMKCPVVSIEDIINDTIFFERLEKE